MLFIKDNFILIIVQIIQVSVVCLVYWLDGYREIKPLLYGVFLSLFIFTLYLIYRYITRRSYYQLLMKEEVRAEDFLQKTSHLALPNAFNQLLKKHYQAYESNLAQERQSHEAHLLFLDRWIHQMKTPLSVIELIALKLDEPDSSDIREETEQMKFGLQTVLQMSRIQGISQDFKISQVNLNQALKDVLEENKRFLIRHQVFPKIKAEDTYTVATDEKWLHFILAQVIHNAVKYSEENKRIEFELIGREKIELTIKDDGIGISQADLSQVKKAFFTGEHGRKYRESTGVGLYLVSEVCKYLEHDFEIDSKEGAGTSVTFKFNR